jgi:uncharacterized paraquat-inducible protein A
MPNCLHCHADVDVNASKCQVCGRPYAGRESALLYLALLGLVMAVALFLFPAVIVIWPFSASFGHAFDTATHSIMAWIGSAVVWGGVGVWLYRLKYKP